jgi:prepilin-type N-terminal cleavage/methylation domain-containing protein
MRRGLTLIELLLSMTIIVLVTMASTSAFVSALTYENKIRAGRDDLATREQFEDKITNLIRHVWLTSSTTDPNSYFIGGAPSIISTTGGTATTGTTATGTSSTGSSSTSTASGGGGGGGTGAYGTPNVMVFTIAGTAVSGSYLASNDDFETENQNFGPQGGITEVELSEDAVGSGGQGQTGMFLRTQTPSDNDPTQGGNEVNLCPQVSQIGFEFFDGTQWDQSWDSRSQTPAPGRLPAAIRVTYRLTGDTEDHILIVQIPASDVTYLNPVTVTG